MLITCSKCRQEKGVELFSTQRSAPNGKQSKCKECAKQIRKEWSAVNPKKQAARDANRYQRNKKVLDEKNKEWVASNPEKRKEHARAYVARNPDKIKAIGQKWSRENKPRLRVRYAKRRAIKLQATPAWANELAISLIYKEADRLSKTTNVIHEVDHMVPLQSPLVCGLHWEGNLQILTRGANRSKSNKLIL